jgi:serine/threonine protein kinase/Flp pilus assembly protein TadD
MSGEAGPGRAPTPFERARDADARCDRFESDWRAGRRPHIEDYLADAPESIRDDLRPELVALEAALRRECERTTPDESQSPPTDTALDLDPGTDGSARGGATSRPDRPATGGEADEESAIAAAPELATLAGRRVSLDRACDGDPGLSDRVNRLLADHEGTLRDLDPPSVLPGPLAPPAGDLPGESSTGERTGAVIAGRYRLVEEVGEGGMGNVWLAEQMQPVRREVALKLVKPGMDSRSVLARFEAERQALALMDHPNIAKVLDGGTTERGRPFFAMEYVQGVPITKFCDDARLDLSGRLELFATVCRAVQHAHTKGVIHRDLKPSNILVALCDGRPEPKVIDFGLAKALRGPLTERTLLTAYGAVMGTPLYMSPEQAESHNLDVDTRTDVYALGAILYELLTGTPPLEKHRLQQAAWDELLRLIREEDPPRPSDRLSDSGSSPDPSSRHHLEPWRQARQVRGELDWIVMKCLEKDRALRYETADALARDIQHYLADEPVEAGPPGPAYRVRKFARRHRNALASAAAFGLLLLLAASISTWQAVRATTAERRSRANERRALDERDAKERARRAEAEQRRRADEEAAIARAVDEFVRRDLLGQADIGNQAAAEGRDPNVTVRELLDRAALGVEARFRGQDLTEAAIRLTLGQAYRALGEFEEARRHLGRALELRTRKRGAEHRDTLEATRALAGLFVDWRRDDEAERLFTRLVEVRRARFGPDHPDTIQSISDLGDLYCQSGRFGEAEPLLRQALEARRALLGDDHPDTLESMYSFAYLRGAQNHPEAESWYKRVWDGRRATLGEDHPRTLESATSLALVYQEQGRLDEAEALYDRILATHRAKLGDEHPLTLYVLHNLAELYRLRGRNDDSESLLKQVIEARRRKVGPDHPATLQSLGNLGVYYQMWGRLDAAQPILEEMLAAQRRTQGAHHPDTIVAMANLGSLYRDRGRLDEAESLLREALAGAREAFGLGDPMVTHQIVNHLAILHAKQGKPQLSEPILREVVAHLREHAPPDSAAYGNELGFLSRNLLDQKKYGEAESILRESLALAERNAPDHWRTSAIRSSLGSSLREQGEYAEAELLLLRGYEGLKARRDQIPAPLRHRIVEALESIVQLYEARGESGEAAAWRAKLQAELASAADPDAGFPINPFVSP